MRKAKEIQDAEREELLALYHVTVQDLAFFKNQQWTLTNYISLAFAAIVSIPQVVGEIGQGSRFILSLVATVVFVFAALILRDLTNAIDERRQRLKRTCDSFSAAFQWARGEKDYREAENESLRMLRFLVLLLGTGLALVWWLLNCE